MSSTLTASADELRFRLHGGLHEPGDSYYEDSRTLFNTMINRRPRYVAECLAVDDVVAALAFARGHDLPVAVRAGGHSVAGLSLCDDGLVLDVRGMADIDVDPGRRIARVGGGGLYRALAQGPATPAVLADRTGCHERYLTEWLNNQAAGGYVSYDLATGEFFLSDEQAFCLADPSGPNISAAFLIALGYLRAEPRITEAFRTGAGLGWHEHHEDVSVGCDAFSRPGYVAELVPSWIPAPDGVAEKLAAGARVADFGCGLGSSSVLIAQAYPNTEV